MAELGKMCKFGKKKVERQRKRERRIILQKNRAKLKKTKGKGDEMHIKVLKRKLLK